jgi:membrane protease YdiL (CAAX protease family)
VIEAGTGNPTPAALPPPGWYADPWRVSQWRWWDGRAWSGYTDQAYVARTYSAAPPTNPDETRPIRAGWTAILGMVTGVALSIAIYMVASLLGVSSGNPILLLVAQLGLWTGLLGACFIAVRRHGTGRLADLGLRIRAVDPALGLGYGVASLTGVGVIARVITSLGIDPKRSSFVGPVDRSTTTVVVLILIIVIGAPIVEELFFRGLLMSGFVDRFGPPLGIIFQAIVFGLVHISRADFNSDLGVFLLIAPVGTVLGVLRYGYKRLGPGIFTHAVYNAIIVMFVLAR